MVTEVIQYRCDVTGSVFNTKPQAITSERTARAIQYLRDRCGIHDDTAKDVLRCIEQKPELFSYVIEDIS